MTSIAFAVGVVRLGRRQCLVNELPAIEGLARVDVVCADKTGTLTENGMRRVRMLQRRCASDEPDRRQTCWRSWPPTTRARTPACRPSPRPTRCRRAGRATATAPFKSATKWSGTSYGEHGNWVIGAPDVLLDPASHGRRTGRADRRAGPAGAAARLAATCPSTTPTRRAPSRPVALVVLEQRVRPDARDTLDYFASQKVSVKVISGDNAVSVGAVAGSLGLRGRDDGRPQAARRAGRSSPTRWRSTPPSAGCGPTRSGRWCTRCSRAGTRSR